MIKNLQRRNRARPPSRMVVSRRGFVILFAVTLSAIFLAIALGISNIALKELKFSTSAKDTNDAFFAADTGIERTLFKNYKSNSYPYDIRDNSTTYSPEIITGLGSAGTSCAKVNITKSTLIDNGILLTIISKGYNIGDASSCPSSPNSIEREITAFFQG